MGLNIPQQAVAGSTKRFRVLIGGRRLGKTFLAIRELARFGRQPNKRILYIAPSYRQAKQIVWKDLKARLSAVNWVQKINESELMITLVNGTEIMLRSADNYDSIRGLGVDFVVFDEFADIATEAWTEVVRPALSDRQGHALFIGTPKGFNWAKDLYDRGQLGLDDWDSWQFDTLSGGNVSQAEIEAAMDDLDMATFRQEYMASFETSSMVIYYNFKNNYVVTEKPEITEKDVLHVGMDFNVAPLVAVIAKLDKTHINVFDEIQIYSSNTAELCQELKTRYPDNKIVVYPDASGGFRSTKGTTDHNIIRAAGFEVKSPRKNPPVKDRINSVNAALENANGLNRLLIHHKCKHLMECLKKQSYKENTQIPDKDTGFDHMNDALGYMIHSLLPIKRPEVERDQPDHYGSF